MTKKTFDNLDKAVIRILKEECRIPLADLAKRLGVTSPTIRSRLKKLMSRGLLRLSALINPEEHNDLTTALIGIRVQSEGKVDQTLEKIAAIKNVTWAAIVSGRYDIIAELVVTGGVGEIHRVMSEKIYGSPIVQTETFIVFKSSNKWIITPEGMDNW
jgi:Lrp/AsnC family transcriptional regulator for asnA, asnC and gidA